MITQEGLVAALSAIGIDAEVQVRLDGIPLEIAGVRLDEPRGVIVLALDEELSREALRQFVARVIQPEGKAAGDGHSVRRNSRGHFELLDMEE